MPSLRAASRRQLTLFVAISGVLLAALAAVFVPVPYVILSPGPTLNTLGTGPGGRSLIQITGHPVYPTAGHLNLVTVSFQGGPSDSLNVFAALRAWLTPHEAVVPQEELFIPGQTQQQVVQQDTQQMTSSQQTATAAALCVLGIKFQVVDTVAVVAKGLPADGVLRRGDVITAVDGKPVTCKASAASLIRARSPGAPVTLTIARTVGGHRVIRRFPLKTAAVQGTPVVGVRVTESYVFPFNVRIRVGDIGGPSAGLMFALGIVDKLTRGNLTGGRFVAGTGEISADGSVSAIGGIQQKMAGARQAGATLFLTPAANCPDTAGAVPAGMHLVKVRNLASAVSALHALAEGRSVPSC
ncbi:MAG: PDZ domain-containing protein [Streptosporangiales bacterium]